MMENFVIQLLFPRIYCIQHRMLVMLLALMFIIIGRTQW
jgi:hypothetical protein